MKIGIGQTSERMKAYHRAVKRHETWAVKIAAKLISDPIQGLFQLIYSRGRALEYMTDVIKVPNPLLALAPRHEDFCGVYMPMPKFCCRRHGIRSRSSYRCHDKT